MDSLPTHCMQWFLADRTYSDRTFTVGLYATVNASVCHVCDRRSSRPSFCRCNACIVAKRCVIEQKLLLAAIRSRICAVDLYQSKMNDRPLPLYRGHIKAMPTCQPLRHIHQSPLNISETVRDRSLVPLDHQ